MKKLLMMIASLFVVNVAHSQLRSSIEFKTHLSTVKGGKPLIGINYSLLKPISENAYIGGGIGLLEQSTFKSAPTIPIMLRTEFDINKSGNVIPFLTFNLGYALNCQKIKNGEFFINPTVALRFNDKFYIGVGYNGGSTFKENSQWGNWITLNLGANIGTVHRNKEKVQARREARRRFFSHVDFGMELIESFGFKNIKLHDNYYNLDYEYKNLRFDLLGFNWLYNFNEHWSAGLGLNIGMVTYKGWETLGYEGVEYKKQRSGLLDIFLRGKYTYKEVAKNLKPYASLDFGGGIGSGCLISPQIGVKYKDKYSLGISVANRTNAWGNLASEDELDKISKNSVNIEIHGGINF